MIVFLQAMVSCTSSPTVRPDDRVSTKLLSIYMNGMIDKPQVVKTLFPCVYQVSNGQRDMNGDSYMAIRSECLTKGRGDVPMQFSYDVPEQG